MALCTVFAVQANNYANDCNDFCQSLNLEVHGGIYPTFWVGRNSCQNNSGLEKFNDFFKLPWYVGARFGYELNDCCMELYGEVNFAQAKGKTFNFSCTGVDGSAAVTSKASHYRIVSGYFGNHYYFASNCFCDNVDFFAGIKVGFIYHKAINTTISSTSSFGNLAATEIPLFCKTTTVSAGGSVGLNYDFCECLSLVFCVELVGSGALKSNTRICLPAGIPGIDTTILSHGQMNAELSIPVTLGIRWQF